jgi:hypothetical protein
MEDRRRMVAAHRIRSVELQEMAREAHDFLASHSWCAEITNQHLAWGVAGVIAVFFFQISSGAVNVDQELWVVVGDIPPAYIVTPKDEGWQAALRAYVTEMNLWVHAAQASKSVDDLIPVNVPPTREYASMLSSRLAFITREFLLSPPGSVARNV